MSRYPRANLINAPHESSYSTQAQAVETIITRPNASQYLVLDSKNRNQIQTGSGVSYVSPIQNLNPITSKTSSTSVIFSEPEVAIQPWNNFRLARPQSVMESFATRLVISEIRFPWWIPNITRRNNTFWMIEDDGEQYYIYDIQIAPGFYTPAEIITQITQSLIESEINLPPVLSYFEGQYTFTAGETVSSPTRVIPSNVVYPLKVGKITINKRIKPRRVGAPVGDQFIVWNDPTLISQPDEYIQDKNSFYVSPSLLNTLGFTWEQVNYNATFVGEITGNITETLYTQYVDILSDKLNQYTTNLDGNSNASASSRLLLRLYLSDEVSIFNNYGSDQLYQPFLIHRQLKNPKEVMWNKDAVVDWLDIRIVDQYNNLVPLPETTTGYSENQGPVLYRYEDGAYPDFQITLLATEN
jgi:hypothetical protein